VNHEIRNWVVSGGMHACNYRAYACHGFGNTMALRGWVGPGVYHVGPRWRYAYRYPRHNQHWYSYKFSFSTLALSWPGRPPLGRGIDKRDFANEGKRSIMTMASALADAV
jgi:hypothetical protein